MQVNQKEKRAIQPERQGATVESNNICLVSLKHWDVTKFDGSGGIYDLRFTIYDL